MKKIKYSSILNKFEIFLWLLLIIQCAFTFIWALFIDDITYFLVQLIGIDKSYILLFYYGLIATVLILITITSEVKNKLVT
ncbi:hypothetical protein A2533_02625 [Candidatus Falkowbacteria bacterium RIFOXYD2_FULL_35_9]|uniref:Uncharacterized protein n=1 Tax=Candidatus Falkowbacteria bacterium RIFOXYC2_FULL_36_12 TaxID=1798002 RepID=A0A1F5T442_9BACT|nr:MAG: hypothetical protein A2300_03775 [Candidatus Falkowbacteria bacterium RIFOXYB2_FULL_35_7]OGF33493.1 MAG: hypothetical protein A2478_02290 [Candidatus Falkowbacteria bacterium RIFOXYC2_FULL_36_12]OGF33543.1 MAG: hypothetical protein A2223_01005 [Candidatus Falkowbacteria bacterium RIFOXYA2_FULL_35_8]OGF47761.1 MAG: hypothetical protein A2533_02625 [Candidatus Falkowbacteria bacterium RIFOXYD2_FULL_35_9]